MKRVYRKRKAKKIRDSALEQLRETRAHIERTNPDLLESVRKIIERAARSDDKKGPEVEAEALPNEMIYIDRKKNLDVILKYAASRPDPTLIKEELKKFLN